MLDQQTPDDETAGRNLRAEFILHLQGKRREAIAGRAASGIETEWTEDEEHYQGIDDANRKFQSANNLMRARKQVLIGSDPSTQGGSRSVIFLNITRPYTDAASARVADMLLPTDNRSWEIKPTPLPELTETKLAKLARAMGGDPEQIKAMLEEQAEKATEAAGRMQQAIEDPLVESNWHGEVRHVIEDAARIGSGVLKGPFPKVVTSKLAKKDPLTGATTVVKVDDLQPCSKRIDPWNLFPDPGCGESIHHGSYIWERDHISKRQVKELLADDTYDRMELLGALKEGPTRSHEGTESVYRPSDDEYEMWIFHGHCARDHLLSLGIDLDIEEEDERLPAMAVMINDRLVKVVLSPIVDGEFPYDVLAWQRRPGMPWGMGISRQIRTVQRMLNGAARAMMDNSGLSAAPQVVIGNGVTPADGEWSLRPGKVWRAEPTSDVTDVRGAFHGFVVPSVQAELMNIINFALQMAEDTTGMPAMLQGIRGDAPNTLGGMQMQNNNATSVLRRLAKRFDDYMTRPHIQRYFDWMMAYSDDESIKGDFKIEVRASSALVERDAQQQFLMTLLQVASNPAYELDPAKLAAELCKGQRLDPKNFLLDDEKKVQQAQQQQAPQDPTLQAKAQLLMSQARKADADATARSMETLYSGVQTAQVIAQTPQTAALADGLAKSAGFIDRNVGPIYPEPASPLPAVDMPENTNPMTPANPGVGMMAGIETQEADGVIQQPGR